MLFRSPLTPPLLGAGPPPIPNHRAPPRATPASALHVPAAEAAPLLPPPPLPPLSPLPQRRGRCARRTSPLYPSGATRVPKETNIEEPDRTIGEAYRVLCVPSPPPAAGAGAAAFAWDPSIDSREGIWFGFARLRDRVRLGLVGCWLLVCALSLSLFCASHFSFLWSESNSSSR